MKIRFVSWDFRTPPTGDEIVTAIRSFVAGPIYATSVNAGTEDYIIALSDEPISGAQALQRWLDDESVVVD